MIDTDRLDDTADTGLRDTIESSVATHDPGGPDTEALVGYAREDHARSIKKQNDESTHADRSDRLRRSIRDAVNATKLKAAQPEKPKTGAEAPIGPPQTWSLDAKAEFKNLPHDVKMATLREQKAFTDAVQPIAERFTEIEKVLAPHRHVYQQAGVRSDAEAINRLFMWENAIRQNPVQALSALAYQYGVDLQSGQQYQPQQYQQGHQPTHEVGMAQAQQTLAEFSKGRAHFSDASVRYDMGILLSTQGHNYMTADGNINLQKAYDDVVRTRGLSGNSSSSKRRAAVSPRGGSPAGRVEETRRSAGIRGSIKDAFRQARDRD
jgi:hypothetical protein